MTPKDWLRFVAFPGHALLPYKARRRADSDMIFEMSFDEQSPLQREDPVKKKTMKRLTCRKCEGHGFISVLKGHAAVCPFNECNCDRCSSVMSMRANALIRRFRHRQPGQNSAVLKTIRSKNGNMRLRIVPKGDQVEEGTTITYTDESSARAYVVSSSALSRSVSGSSSPSLPTTPPLLPPNATPPMLSGSQELVFEYLQQMLQAKLLSDLLTQQSNPIDVTKPTQTPTISPLLAQTLLLSSFQPLQQFLSIV
ncbi:hypothetical protein Y032_0321g2419 [Ancylostoma ceylanicum]|uniref:DM domain-containing protein n=1 Tax=Ancylostoma ceylanicum TaxID=53326 RepID=A0A016S0N9_9BILA|nr:hypothetical protein Y032_0321g2419 [Ancylostoma ceylanicum]